MWFRRRASPPEWPPSHDSEAIRLKVLDEAEFGRALYELLWPVFHGQGRGSRQVFARTLLEETRGVVRELLETGHISVVAGRSELLDLEAARQAVADDRNWLSPGPEGSPISFDVAITESGADEWLEMVMQPARNP
jgi:hypothetical protein